jgi:type IV secretory pathway VirB4 component
MPYLKKQNLFKEILFSRTTALVILFAVFFTGYGLVSLIGKSINEAKARKLAEAQASVLSKKQADLSEKLSVLNTTDGQESALREQFPVVKEGEHVVVITGDDDKASSVAGIDTDQSRQGGFWNFIKNIFK